jgi:pyruvate kinase
LLAVPEGSVPTDVEDGVVLVPVQGKRLKRLKPGDRLQGRDASGRKRRFTVRARRPEGVLLHCRKSCHLTAGLVFRQRGGKGRLTLASLPPAPGERRLRTGERLTLTPEPDRGPGTIPCTRSEVFFDLRIGEQVLFDGGRIAAVIRSVAAEAVLLEITRARPRGSRLGAGRGIHLPDSDLRAPALTARDLEDLAFATGHADILPVVGVNRDSDIEALHRALEAQGREDRALLLRIETRRAYLNLPGLLLMAMRQGAPFGVLIGRDALAVECGTASLAAIEDEIRRLCAAAQVPCLWVAQETAALEPVRFLIDGANGYPAA